MALDDSQAFMNGFRQHMIDLATRLGARSVAKGRVPVAAWYIKSAAEIFTAICLAHDFKGTSAYRLAVYSMDLTSDFAIRRTHRLLYSGWFYPDKDEADNGLKLDENSTWENKRIAELILHLIADADAPPEIPAVDETLDCDVAFRQIHALAERRNAGLPFVTRGGLSSHRILPVFTRIGDHLYCLLFHHAAFSCDNTIHHEYLVEGSVVGPGYDFLFTDRLSFRQEVAVAGETWNNGKQIAWKFREENAALLRAALPLWLEDLKNRTP